MKRLISIILPYLVFSIVGIALIAHSQQLTQPVGVNGQACAYNASPQTISSGQAGWIQCDSSGKLYADTAGSSLTPLGVTSTMATVAPTAGTFSSALAANTGRKGCQVQNIGTTLGYAYFGANASATTGNSFLVSANGGTISCNSANGLVLQDNVSLTCLSGTCAFVIDSQ